MKPNVGRPDPPLRHVSLWLCALCISGVGGECHSPGCALYLSSAPDLRLADHVTDVAEDQ